MNQPLCKAPGDRGGHVLGMTASGRPIYDDAHAHAPMYHRFEPRDHAAALAAHLKAADASGVPAKRAELHQEIARSHRKAWEHMTSPAGRLRSWAQQYEALARSAPSPVPVRAASAQAVLGAYLAKVNGRC